MRLGFPYCNKNRKHCYKTYGTRKKSNERNYCFEAHHIRLPAIHKGQVRHHLGRAISERSFVFKPPAVSRICIDFQETQDFCKYITSSAYATSMNHVKQLIANWNNYSIIIWFRIGCFMTFKLFFNYYYYFPFKNCDLIFVLDLAIANKLEGLIKKWLMSNICMYTSTRTKDALNCMRKKRKKKKKAGTDWQLP